MADVRIVEVGPRDGLQNEKIPVPIETKLDFIRALADAGLQEIEATSFVSPKWVPQLADSAELWEKLPSGPLYSALVPNMKGLERALDLGVSRIALFTAASDDFTRRNINMTVDDSLSVFEEVARAFRAKTGAHGWLRGYVSTAFECPYAGRVDPEAVTRVCERLLAIGVDEISIGDTVGVAVPAEVAVLTRRLLDHIPVERIAYHFHDTRGMAVANVAEALRHGVRIFDSSAGGLGGCPYAPGAGGNLATEDLVYFLERTGLTTGVKASAVALASVALLAHLGRRPSAKAQLAALAAC